jgi:hypothetical protein
LNALAFNGTTGFVDIGALAIPTDFTVEAWIRPVALTTEQLIVGKDRSGTSQSQFRFGLIAGGRPFFLMTDAQGNDHGLYNGAYVVLGPTAMTANQWTHLAVVKSGAAFSIVVNGTTAVAANADGSFTHGGSQPFRVAARLASDGVSATSFFDGTIDEVRVWNVGRSAAQISADMAHALAPSDPQYASLVGYWRFDEGTGATASDRIGAHAGTLVGNPTWVVSSAF